MTKWIPLLVRIEDYADLATQVAAREALRPDDDPSAIEASLVSARGQTTREEERLALLKPWSLADLRQIIDTADRYKTMARWAKAMDVMARHPGPDGFRSTAQVAEESGMSVNEWRDAPRKLPQHLQVHFPGTVDWPLKAVGGRKLGRDDQVYWGITVEQANRWLRVRAEADAGDAK